MIRLLRPLVATLAGIRPLRLPVAA
jgi:hypothetical protein